jgi:hypothetical protein
MSPAMVAAAAVEGAVTDVREFFDDDPAAATGDEGEGEVAD